MVYDMLNELFNLKDFSHIIIIECRTKCPALIHECWTYNIFYQTMFDVRRLFRFLRPTFFSTICSTRIQYMLSIKLFVESKLKKGKFMELIYVNCFKLNWLIFTQIIPAVDPVGI